MSSESRILAASRQFEGKSMPDEPRTLCAIYARCSNESLKSSSTLLAGQVDHLKEEVEKRGYLLLDRHIYAEAKSTSLRRYKQRKEFMRMLSAAQAGEFPVLFVEEFSRVGRDMSETTYLMYLLTKECLLRVESLSAVDNQENSPAGNMMRAIQMYQNDIDRQRIREHCMRGRAYRGKTNLLGQGVPLYGYKFVDTDDYNKARYSINTDPLRDESGAVILDHDATPYSEAKVVLLVFTLYLQGLGVRRIALELTSRGIPTRTGKPYWNDAVIYAMLVDTSYMGEAYSFKYEQFEKEKKDETTGQAITLKYSRLRPEEEQILLPEGTIPPLVPREMFEQVQRTLATRKQEALRNAKYEPYALLRAGRCRCSLCNHTMRVHNLSDVTDSGERVLRPDKSYYRCYRNNGREDELHNHSVYMLIPELDAHAWSFALEHLHEPQRVRAEAEKLFTDTTQQDGFITHAHARLEEIQKSINRLVKLAATAEDETLTEIESSLALFQEERKRLQVRLASMTDTTKQRTLLYQEIERIEAWIATIALPPLSDPSWDPPYEDKEEIIRYLGISAVVYPKGSVRRFQLRLGPPAIDLLKLKTFQYCATPPPALITRDYY